MNLRGQVRQGFLLWVVIGVLLPLAGCVTLESPGTRYELTTEGFKTTDKTQAQTGTETIQPVTTDSQTVDVSQQKVVTTEQSGNKKGAWGFCCRQGRGREPEPMRGFEFSYPLDVDTAYIKVKREFDFLSRDDLSKKPFVQDYMESKRLFHLRYEATPGVHYKMRNFVEHPYGSEESSNTIEVELSKDGANKVNIRVMYYAGNTKDPKGYEASLKQRIKKTLGNS